MSVSVYINISDQLRKLSSALFELSRMIAGNFSSHFLEVSSLEKLSAETSNFADTYDRKQGSNEKQLNALLGLVINEMESLRNLISVEEGVPINVVDLIVKKISGVKSNVDTIYKISPLILMNSVSENSDDNFSLKLSKINKIAIDFEAKVGIFETQLTGLKKQLAMSQASANEAAENFINNQKKIYKDEVDNLINYLELKKETINDNEVRLNEVISVMASKALSGSFMKNALKEEDVANLYRRIALVTMIGLGLFFVLNFIVFEFELVTKDAWVNRIIIGLFFSFLIGYLVRQSAVHRGQQFMYLQKALDLAALSPYVANLPEEVQHKIKHQMAEKLFVVQGGSSCQDTQAFGAQELLGKLIDKLEFPQSPR